MTSPLIITWAWANIYFDCSPKCSDLDDSTMILIGVSWCDHFEPSSVLCTIQWHRCQTTIPSLQDVTSTGVSKFKQKYNKIFFFIDLPLNYSQNIPRDGNEDPNDESGPFRRSISQTLLSQLSSPTYQGIASRGASPSPFLNSRNKNRPSIQSLISSFINKVSRGTQTDCDDNFDQLSIASAATGFSTFANDLTKSRIKMFLNDQMTGNHLDETDFVDELSKLRYEINGQFGQKNEDLESLDDRQSLASQYENELNDFATITSSENKSMSAEPAPKQPSPPLKTKKVDPRKMFMDTAMETDRLLTSDISCQVDIEIKPSTSEKYCQTDVIHDESVVPDRRSICVENRPEQRTIETQTDRFVFCDHCCGSEMLKSDLEKSADNVQTTSSSTNPPVTKYEFIITVSFETGCNTN